LTAQTGPLHHGRASLGGTGCGIDQVLADLRVGTSGIVSSRAGITAMALFANSLMAFDRGTVERCRMRRSIFCDAEVLVVATCQLI
jgi:hypothetical protein